MNFSSSYWSLVVDLQGFNNGERQRLRRKVCRRRAQQRNDDRPWGRGTLKFLLGARNGLKLRQN